MAQEHQSQMEYGLSSRMRSLKEGLEKSPNRFTSSSSSSANIYRVPMELREGNDQHYTPTTISIGPLHHRRYPAEELKIRAFKFYFSHSMLGGTTFDDLIYLLKEKEESARQCYNAEDIKDFSSDEFVEMMLLDGCFIIALILMDKNHMFMGSHRNEDFVFMGRARGTLLYNIQQDLLLLENQLPFFVVEDLWQKLATQDSFGGLSKFALDFFADILPATPPDHTEEYSVVKPKHLLELVLITLFPVPPWSENQSDDFLIYYPLSMSELALHGIKLKSKKKAKSLADVEFYSNGVLEIPTLVIQESTTSLFKNLLALEQCQEQIRSCFTSYLFLMDALVDTEKDIEQLLEARVLKTWLNDKQALVSLLSGLNTNLLFASENLAIFEHVYMGLLFYCSSRYARWRASFMRYYYASRWDILNSILIFIFTVTQTIFTILSYNPKK